MSEGREKLNNFSKLKSIVSSGIKEKAARFKKTRDDRLQNTDKTSSQKHPPVKKPEKTRRQSQHTQTVTSGNQKVMPQYGQKQHSIDQQQQNDQGSEEIVVNVGTDDQNDHAERQLFAWLCQTFPKCFNPRYKKPLKIGISDDIQVQYQQAYKLPVDQYTLSRVLKRYVGDQKYQHSVLKHKQRYDLQGRPVESFTEAHLAHAQQRLEELQFKAKLRAQGIDVRQYYQEKQNQAAKERVTESDSTQCSQQPDHPIDEQGD